MIKRLFIAIVLVCVLLCVALLWTLLSPFDMTTLNISGADIISRDEKCVIICETNKQQIEIVDVYLIKVIANLIEGGRYAYSKRAFRHPVYIRYRSDSDKYGILAFTEDGQYRAYWFDKPILENGKRPSEPILTVALGW